MIRRLEKAAWLRDMQRFLENFDTPPALKLCCFHPVQLPIVITEAHVRMRSVQDYSVLALLILRLFDAGITTPEAIRDISGMSLETVNTFIQKEKLILEHIDPQTNRLTEMGVLTLRENEGLEGDSPRSCQYFDSVLRVHIDPLTASLIPQYLEYELGDNIKPDEEAGDFVLARESAEADETFRRELNTRLVNEINELKKEREDRESGGSGQNEDLIKNQNILDSVTAFEPIRIFYRWGYFAQFEGMRYPMVVLSGRKTVERTENGQEQTGSGSVIVLRPVALAQSDWEYLEENGIVFDGVLQRSDDCFAYLRDTAQSMTLTLPDPEEPDTDEDNAGEDPESSTEFMEDDDTEDEAYDTPEQSASEHDQPGNEADTGDSEADDEDGDGDCS